MRKPFPLLIAAALAVAACSPSSSPEAEAAKPADPMAAAVRDANAEFARLRAQDNDKTAHEIAALEYPAYRALMKFSGLDAALGGEAQADAALRALFALYERKVRSFESDLPKMLKMADTGAGIGYSGFGASLMTGMMQGDAAVAMWEQAQRDGKPDGEFSQAGNGSSIETQWSGSHSSSTSEFEGKLPGGLAGKIRTKVEIDTCPDANGRIKVKFVSDSQLRSSANPGAGGTVKVTADLAMYVGDDAELIDGQMDSDVHVEQSAFGDGKGSFVDVTSTLSTTRGVTGTKVNRRSQAATDADVQAAEGVAKIGMMAAMRAVQSAKQAWQSGACVTLEATSNPAKRKGIKPNITFAIDAKPRAKSDGLPTGGSVTATLSGPSSLQPASGKVPADAKYQYAGPAKKDESASIAFESRSKRGVGKATLEFDTKAVRAYTAAGGLDDFHGTGTICDLSKPFTISGGGNTVTFTPSSEQGGSYSYQGNMGGIGVYGKGTYTASADENGGKITGSGNGCVKTPMGTRCNSGTERYTLTPTEPCE